jgi:hypothetical protein
LLIQRAQLLLLLHLLLQPPSHTQH